MGGGWSGGRMSGGMSSRAAVGGARVGAWNGSRSAAWNRGSFHGHGRFVHRHGRVFFVGGGPWWIGGLTAAGNGFRRRGDRVASGPATTSNGPSLIAAP
jgi:hypothetical protein